MLQGDDVGGAPQLDFGVGRALLRSNCGGSIGLPQPVSSRRVQPLNEIAEACAFRDDAYFTGNFHKWLDDSPGACAGRDSGGDAVRAGTEKSASPARDVAFRTS